MMEIGKKIKKLGKANIYILMEVNILVSGEIIKDMVTEHCKRKMVINMKVNGEMTNQMEKEFLNKKRIYMKVIGKTEKKMVMV